MMTRAGLATLAAILLLARAHAEPLQMHLVPTPIKSYRLLAMSMDEDGFIWTGSVHRVIHRYDPRTGRVENIPLPYQANASACLCASKKVYVLGQAYPRLIIYDRTRRQFRETAYPSARPDVWYGSELVADRYLYLFDRGRAGIIKWDTQTDQGRAIPYPYQTPLPAGGHYEPRDQGLWCRLWDFSDGKYKPIGQARLDVKTDRFSGWWQFPKDDTGLLPYTDPAGTMFLPYSLRGKIVPFDFQKKRWCRFLDAPGFGKVFGFMGGPWLHRDRCYFSLSTYDGDDLGCDGQPYHFCNAILEFDPKTRRSRFLTLEAKDAYYQISYMLSAGNEFFATGSNIRAANGKLDQGRPGQVVFWQTRPLPP